MIKLQSGKCIRNPIIKHYSHGLQSGTTGGLHQPLELRRVLMTNDHCPLIGLCVCFTPYRILGNCFDVRFYEMFGVKRDRSQ
uniref:Metallothionein n=1 Tax=Rhizophora mucronata TaxID=61149 RepID=A0A2P2IXU6_RHIMU